LTEQIPISINTGLQKKGLFRGSQLQIYIEGKTLIETGKKEHAANGSYSTVCCMKKEY
jgi:hypothetical protein